MTQNTTKPRRLSHKILVVCDQTLSSRRLIQLIQRENDFAVCGEVISSVKPAARAIRDYRPRLVLAITNVVGSKICRLLCEVRSIDPTIKMLVISGQASPKCANHALRAGAHGYLITREAAGEVVHAIRDVLAGHIYLSDALMDKPGRSQGRNRRGMIRCCFGRNWPER